MLTELKVYNVLSEDNEQRELLYEVCKATEFRPRRKKDKDDPLLSKKGMKQLSAKTDSSPAEVNKPETELKSNSKKANPRFEMLFPSMHEFSKIFD